MSKKPKQIVEWDVDEATYIGNEDDGVYYQVAEGPGGWYMTAVVDCNTASFVATIVEDDGPYPTEQEAEMAGKNAAYGWLIDNQVAFDDDPEADGQTIDDSEEKSSLGTNPLKSEAGRNERKDTVMILWDESNIVYADILAWLALGVASGLMTLAFKAWQKARHWSRIARRVREA